MSLSVKFNDVELNQYLNVLSGFSSRSGPEWEPSLFELSGTARGSIYQYTSYKSKQIKMPFEINGNIEDKYNALMGVLNVDEPKALIFGDVPEKVYYAIPSGSLDLEEIYHFGSGTITWLIPDGVAHSLTEKTAQNNGASAITLVNNGTEAVPVSLKIKMTSDNGYIGLTLDDRFYQIGKPEEVDGVTHEETVLLFDDHLNVDKGWLVNQGVTPPVTGERLQNGTVGYVEEYADEGYVHCTGYGTGNSWHGAAVTKIVPADVNGKYPVNWFSCWRYDLNTAGGSTPGAQIGHNSVTFSDENDNIIVAVVFEDNNASLERSDMVVYIGNTRIWDTKETTKFLLSGRGTGPVVSVEKIGSQITVAFSYAGIRKTFQAVDADAELRKVTWYGAAYKQHKPMTNNLLRALQVKKHNVERYEDIPNYFGTGDEVYIDGEMNEVYINDIYDADMVDIGSQPLLLPPGQHTLGIVTSSFAETPEVEVTWKERWI